MAQKTATVAVINQDKKILILRRGATAPWMPYHYCLPGGKVENNEDLIECASRELGEETGIAIVDNNLLSPFTIRYSDNYSKVIYYTSMNNPRVSLNWEHDHYAWVDSLESCGYNLVPGLKTTIKTLRDSGLLI